MEHSLDIKEKAKAWLEKGLDEKEIKNQLASLGIDDRYMPEMLKEIKKLRQSKSTANGLVYILIGAVMCLFSCVYTIVAGNNSELILYGLTSLGIIIIFIGLVKIFG